MTTDFLTLFDQQGPQEVVSEEQFSDIVKPFARPLLSLSYYVEEMGKGSGKLMNMGFLANTIKHSSDLEHLLDRYHARNNRNWLLFRELTATIKNFSKAAFLMEELKKNAHLKTLLSSLDVGFHHSATASGHFFVEIISWSFEALQKEAHRLNLPVPKKRSRTTYGVKLRNEIILPHTIEESTSPDKVHTVKKFVHDYAEFAQEVQFLGELIRSQPKKLVSEIPGRLNEGVLRDMGTKLHNFQSKYDSYIEQSRIERDIPELRGLHEIFPIELNLFKIATILVHYFERHLLPSSSPVLSKLGEVVPSSRLIEEVLYFSLHFLTETLRSSGRLADAILNRLVDVVTYEVPVPRTLGFHARPSTRVAKVVQHYGANVKMLVDDQVFDAGNVLEMLSAGGYIHTKRLDRVHFRGDKQALNDLKLLADHNYGETSDGKDSPLPDALSYLR